ncbi:acyltransferase family protein [Methylocystis sp. WRRC1]|uniref:acyltransferase family protein n=1 Tax=Methylocystis sp. WRRC1 TaxID=1732014 RepID=UPI001D140301|nr:acyltransferase family protein [Methylocystis sp. WRRC1]MCC3243945.1 acyltransferase family protein [Methylocystis sp. WRRC1]
MQSRSGAQERVDWVDYAKGWCIILVVMMHSTLGVEESLGRESWLNDFIDWARPFRMPDFFLVGGLFLSRTIDRPWGDYLDRKVLHFVYFFVLWTLIQGAPKLLFTEGADPLAILHGLAFAMVEPFGTLWFIYLLPIFFVVTKALRRAEVDVVLFLAAMAQIAGIETPSTVVDEFASRFVYFYGGYAFAPQIFAFAERARANARKTIAALFLWGVVNGLAVRYGLAPLPGVSLVLGFVGAAAVVAFSALLAQARILPVLPALGARSIVVYLAFFLPMAMTRVALVKSGLNMDAGLLALIVTASAISVPLAMRRFTQGTRLGFLFERPAFFRLPREPQRQPLYLKSGDESERRGDAWPFRRDWEHSTRF